MLKTKTKSGFTLIEILIVIAIMVIMTAVLFANKNNDTAGKDVDAAAQQVVSQLRALQNDALNGKQMKTSSGQTMPAIKFEFWVGGTNSYYIEYVDATGGKTQTMPTVTLKNVSLSTPANPIILFSPFGAVDTPATMTIASTKSGSTNVKKYVCIESGGNIEALTTKTSACP